MASTRTPPSGSSTDRIASWKPPSTWRSRTILRWYGLPVGVTALSVFARFSVTTSMRARCAVMPEALICKARKRSTAGLLHASGDRLLHRGEARGEELDERVVEACVLGEARHLSVQVHVVAVVARRAVPGVPHARARDTGRARRDVR